MRSANAPLVLAVATAATLTFGVQGIASALPAIQRELAIGDSQLALLTALYVLPGVVLAIPLGYAADTLGRRRVFVAMTVLFGVAGVAQAFADDLGTLLVLRFLQGVGFASLMPLTVTLLGDAYTGAAQLRAQGQRQLGMQVAELLLPLAGAGLAALAWNAPFFAQGLMLPLALLGLMVLDRRQGRGRRVRYASALRGAVVRPGVTALLGAGFLRFVCKFALISYLPVLLVHDRGASLIEAAVVLSVASAAAAAASPLAGRLLRHAPPSRLLMGSVALVGSGLVAFGLAPGWESALAAALLFGAGDGLLSVLQNGLVVAVAPERVRAGLVAASSTTRNAGKLAAPLALGAALLAVSTPTAFVALGVLVVGCVAALRPVAVLDPLLTSRPGGEDAALDDGIRYPA